MDPRRVLIVDEDRDNREVYAEYLRYRGFDTTEASTGAEAVETVARWDPHVVVLDMRLPDADGAQVTRQIRQDREVPPIVIALSACVFDGEIAAALISGCDTFLAKPCLPDRLATEIRRLLRARAVA
jgi:CheY-like chemotaxis protein